MSQSHHYIPVTDDELAEMLAVIGVRDMDALLEPVPLEIREKSAMDLPRMLTETEVLRLLRGKAAQGHGDAISFLGAGIYDHATPAAVDAILQRSEFYTAYTPYQPEVSQGTLQAIYEFQTMVCELFGMDISNASVYDGSSALTEAVLMARAQTRRTRTVFAGPVHTFYRQVLESTTVGMDLEFIDAKIVDGRSDAAKVAEIMDDTTACVVVQQPNFFGQIEDIAPLAEIAHEHGAMLIVSADPLALSILEAPGNLGADIVIGEGQSLGVPSSFGGPALGLFAVKDALKRKLPGRLVGRSIDSRGQQAFVLTLQTREQHIRREKATSNICTNQSLIALAATVYLSLMGPSGLRSVAETSMQNAHYAADQIAEIDGYELAYNGAFLYEFVVRCPRPAREIISALVDRDLLPGVDMSVFGGPADHLMIAVTEKRTRADIDLLARSLAEIGS
jgi:glycine dehydrogenase subunit 1